MNMTVFEDSEIASEKTGDRHALSHLLPLSYSGLFDKSTCKFHVCIKTTCF